MMSISDCKRLRAIPLDQDVGHVFAGYALDEVVAQQAKIDSCQERCVFAKQHRRQSQMQFVDPASKQVRRIVEMPPIPTSFPLAAAFALPSADSIPSVTK